MGSSSLSQVLMLVLTVCVWRGDGQTSALSNTPSWPTTGCSFTRHPDMRPNGFSYTSSTTTTENACEALCLSEVRCGTYQWATGDNSCQLYQFTPALLENRTGIPQAAWRGSTVAGNMGSKDCEVAEISDTVCGLYIGHDRKNPNETLYLIFSGIQVLPQTLTLAMCQSMCDAFDTCVSVQHLIVFNGVSSCVLYNTTITELIATGREDEVVTNTNTTVLPTYITHDCDINECAGSNNCHPQATCTNTPGSFTCMCNDGYSGDGVTCTENNTGVKAKALA